MVDGIDPAKSGKSPEKALKNPEKLHSMQNLVCKVKPSLFPAVLNTTTFDFAILNS